MIKLICVGKIKEQFFRDAVQEYIKRLGKYTKIELLEVDDIKGDSPSFVLRKEKELIEKHLGQKDFIITLEIDGKQMPSLEFSKKLEQIQSINTNITFIIGGSYGIDESIKSKSDFALSFSQFTFPHQLFRVIFLEQLYRAYKILNNETYHK